MKKFIKNNKGFVKGFIFGSVLFVGIATLVAYTASEITYTPSDSSWNVSYVKDALDDLYEKAHIEIRTGSNGWSAKYICRNGTATMTECWYGDVGSGTQCDGGERGESAWATLCTLATNLSYSYLTVACNTSLSGRYDAYGGGMASSYSCSS